MYSHNDIEYFVKNAPLKVSFAGLQGNTRGMQSQGWQIGVEVHRSPEEMAYIIRIAGKHPGMNLRTLSYPIQLDCHMLTVDQGLNFLSHIEINLWVCAEQIVMRCDEAPKFKQVDWSKPELTSITSEILGKHINLDECCFFKPLNDQVDIYVPENKIHTVMDHLKAITDLQGDKQKEIRAKMMIDRRKKECSVSSGEPNSYDQSQEVRLQLVSVA